MAILVMGVGVLSVMTLFPIAYLRSAQATQLTNATILKYRAEALIDMFGLVTDIYIPQPIEGETTRCIIDPLGWQDINPVAPLLSHEYGVQNNGGNLERVRYTPHNSPVVPANQAPTPTRFINVAGLGIVRDVWPMPLRRLGFAAQPLDLANGVPYAFTAMNVFANRLQALGAVRLPDTFQTHFTATPASNSNMDVTFDPTVVSQDELQTIADITAAAALNNLSAARITLVGASGKQSFVRTVTNVDSANRSIAWDTAIPAGLVNNLSEVRVETDDPRYTWLLTVRKRGISGGSQVEIDCVVFFNRSSEDPEEEMVHFAVPIVAADEVPPDDLPTTVKIAPTPYPSGQTIPLRKGRYVFDPTHAQWYRVQDVRPGTNNTLLIRLDQRPRQAVTTLTVPRRVIHVFSLEPRIIPGRSGF